MVPCMATGVHDLVVSDFSLVLAAGHISFSLQSSIIFSVFIFSTKSRQSLVLLVPSVFLRISISADSVQALKECHVSNFSFNMDALVFGYALTVGCARSVGRQHPKKSICWT